MGYTIRVMEKGEIAKALGIKQSKESIEKKSCLKQGRKKNQQEIFIPYVKDLISLN